LASVTRHAPDGTEIIVVDDSSPQEVASRVARAHPGVRVQHLARRSGFCVAANRGIRAAGGTIIEILNDDTEVTPGWVEAALAAFRDPGVAAVAPLVLCHATEGNVGDAPGPLVDSAGDGYYVGGIARKRGHGRRLNQALLYRSKVFGASASSAFFRRDALLEVGAFPEDFDAYFEDVDLCFRLHRAGYGVVFEPGSRVLHRVSSSYGRRNRRLLEQQSRNEERVFWRNLPAATLVSALPRHTAVLAAKALRRCREGAFLPFLFGRLRLLGEVSEIRRHRRQLSRQFPSTDPSTWQIELEYSYLN
jgi:GT2 family glycosyltransferase